MVSEREWGVRVADVRLPRWWPVAVLVSVILAHVSDRRQLRELRGIGADLGDYLGTRDREAAERDARLVALTKTLARVTWVLLGVAVATLVVAALALVLA